MRSIPYATRGPLKICEPKFIYPITEQRAATSEEEAPGKRAKKDRRASNRDPTFEPEETSVPFDQMSPIGHKRLPQRRDRARKEKPDYKALGTVDDGKPISARTRRSTIAQLTKKKQRSRPRSSLPTYKRSPRKRATGICSLSQPVNSDDQADLSNSKLLLLQPLLVKGFHIQRPPPPILIAAHYWIHRKNKSLTSLRRGPSSHDLRKRRKAPPVMLTLPLLYLQTFTEWPRIQPRSASPQESRKATSN